MTTPDPASVARSWIGQAVTGMTGGLGDPRSAVHDPLAALRALAALRPALSLAELDAARRAREDGCTWAQIGEALAVPVGDGQSLAEAAFETVGWARGWVRDFPFTCGSCGQPVQDHGPYSADPSDCERGHAEGCERFAAEIREYDAQWQENADG